MRNDVPKDKYQRFEVLHKKISGKSEKRKFVQILQHFPDEISSRHF